jgi:uncharacterized protein
MMRHLTPSDYVEMPWANGKGVTVEMLRVEQGGLKWRLSRASVVEDGDFSLFAGIERNLTVISGPGFDLIGDGLHLAARPLLPVAFAGDVAVRAEGVVAPSDDFNVMTARELPRPEVRVLHAPAGLEAGGTLALFALEAGAVNGRAVGRYDLIVTERACDTEGLMIAVRLFG